MDLADSGDRRHDNIDILIGAGVYWKLVSGNIKKDDNSGLVAISSIFGWLISGPIENQDNSVNLVASHVLKISCEIKEEKLLSSQLSKFWSLDGIGIQEEETSVYDEFIDNIKFEDGRYKVKLPFKESHPVIPDNYILSKKTFKKI